LVEGENEIVSDFLVDRGLEEPEKQAPQNIAHLYVGSAEFVDLIDAQDSEQRLRWKNFLKLDDEQETRGDILQNTDLVEETMGEAKEQTGLVDEIGIENLQDSLADQIEAGKRLL
jgi:hypothetical protein